LPAAKKDLTERCDVSGGGRTISGMKAKWNGKVIAESDRTLDFGGYRYFPREAVRMELLEIAPKTASDRECPHGVQFYDVADGPARSERAAWSYEAPGPAMKQVDHWIGFWEDVSVEP
jgi:uncharacterized protein (DUF427 family)